MLNGVTVTRDILTDMIRKLYCEGRMSKNELEIFVGQPYPMSMMFITREEYLRLTNS